MSESPDPTRNAPAAGAAAHPRAYLDHNASAPLRPEARAAAIAALEATGNPSSPHAEGRRARAIVERAREQVAAAAGCLPQEVVFTSGATEAAGALRGWPGPVDVQDGAHDALWAQRRDGEGRAMRAMGLANSETGLISEIPESGDSALLLDVTQAMGRIPFDFARSGADLAVMSAHKLGGPRGVGALLVREGLEIAAVAAGGGQESGRRSGTENVAGIAGFGAAAEAARRELDSGAWEEVAALRDLLESALEDSAKAPILVGKSRSRLPNTSCFVSPGWKGESQVIAMDLAGYAVSAGAACSSGKIKTGRALRALGFGEDDAACALRVSLGLGTTREEVLGFAQAWIAGRARRRAFAA